MTTAKAARTDRASTTQEAILTAAERLFAEPRAESPLESVLRLRLHDDGFPPPQLQAEIAGFEVDMLWPKQRLVLEADGRLKYTDGAKSDVNKCCAAWTTTSSASSGPTCY